MLIRSDLVTTVLHVEVGRDRQLSLELTKRDDRLRIVDALSSAWGVRDAAGVTSVWCDLVLDPGERP